MILSSILRSLPRTCTAYTSPWLRKPPNSLRSYCKYPEKLRRRKPDPIKYSKKSDRPIVTVWSNMSIRELARAMNADPDYIFHLLLQTDYADIFEKYEDIIQGRDLIAKLVNLGGFRSQFVDPPGTEREIVVEEDKDAYRRPPPDPSQCLPRPPVATIMGHVDHGKTTVLDYLRKSQIAANEFGGITQHIGAFVVKLPHTGSKITFLDTPGHAAFKSMRARGARVTDIVVLVVAADDGVMEQTTESIRFANEAGVPMVVAINKCDRPNANVKRAKESLLAHNITLEEYGGDVQGVCVSALQGTNMVALQEAIITQAELMNLKADYKGLVEGAVVEAKTVHGKGGVCTVLVQRGTLKKGSVLVAGEAWCKVRTLSDEFGKPVLEATPSVPVEVTGWRDDLPSAGDVVLEVENEKRAREVMAWRKMKAQAAQVEAERPLIERKRAEERERYELARKERLAAGSIKFSPLLASATTSQTDNAEADIPKLSIILKGDVDGSVEALLEVFETYKSHNCKFDIVSFGIGPVVENDLELAEIAKAKIYCFNISNPPAVEKQAREKNLDIKHFNVIYKLVDDWKKELSSLLPLVDKEDIQGQGVVIQEFAVSERNKKVPVAGCRVSKGTLSRKQRLRFIRDGEIIFDGTAASMKREKLVTNSAKEGEEVGIMLDDHTVRFLPNDIVICYETSKISQRIDWDPPGF